MRPMATRTWRSSPRATDSWHNTSGWNAGGGASMLFGHSELFVESRVLAFNPSNAPMARQIPVVFGMNWY